MTETPNRQPPTDTNEPSQIGSDKSPKTVPATPKLLEARKTELNKEVARVENELAKAGSDEQREKRRDARKEWLGDFFEVYPQSPQFWASVRAFIVEREGEDAFIFEEDWLEFDGIKVTAAAPHESESRS